MTQIPGWEWPVASSSVSVGRGVQLPTHILGPEQVANFDVGLPEASSPDYGTGRAVARAAGVATKACEQW